MLRQMIIALLCILPVLHLAAGGPETIISQAEFEDADILNVITVVNHYAGVKVWCEIGHKEAAAAPPVTMSFKNMPAREILRYACIQSGFSFDITDDNRMSVTRKPVLRSLAMTVDILSRDPTPEKLQEYFKSGGVEFPEGSKIFYNRNTNTLTAQNTTENLRRIGLILGADLKSTPKISLDKPVFKIVNPAVERKLSSLMAGPLDSEDITVSALLLWLHRESIANDPEKKGVNFFLCPLPEDFNTLMNVNLARLSLRDILNSVCAATGLTYHFDDYAVVIGIPEKKQEPKNLPVMSQPGKTVSTNAVKTETPEKKREVKADANPFAKSSSKKR